MRHLPDKSGVPLRRADFTYLGNDQAHRHEFGWDERFS
jgi:hypothetical protein